MTPTQCCLAGKLPPRRGGGQPRDHPARSFLKKHGLLPICTSYTVKFDDSTSVRRRLGVLGTSFKVAQELTAEPFVIGSVWHKFED
jgi:hypothetical protein